MKTFGNCLSALNCLSVLLQTSMQQHQSINGNILTRSHHKLNTVGLCQHTQKSKINWKFEITQ